MVDVVVEDIPVSIDADMNRLLTAEYTREEVERALKQMEPLKALGLDGLPPLFSQQYWKCIGDEMSIAILSCWNSGTIPPSINHTFITLIPKVKSLTKVSKYRLISLCNIIYKLVPKVFVNRLKCILPLIISKS